MGKKAAYLKQALALIYFSFLPMLLMSNFEKDFNLLSQKLEALGKLDVLSLYSFSLLLEAFLRLHTFFFSFCTYRWHFIYKHSSFPTCIHDRASTVVEIY